MGRKKRKVADQEPAATKGDNVGVAGAASPPSILLSAASVLKMEATSVAVIADPNVVRSATAASPAIDPRTRGISLTMVHAGAPPSANGDGIPRPGAMPSISIKSATMTATVNGEVTEDYLGSAKPFSQYGLHSHSGDLVEDDVYVSDGSVDSDNGGDDGNENDHGGDEKSKKKRAIELVITTSRMGLMRRGGISSLLGAPQVNRTWVRSREDGGGDNGMKKEEDRSNDDGGGNAKEEGGNEEADLDPAQRLALQHRKIEQAKIQARLLESSENAGRDPCLFSKRTAFDIRMDQIEEKPWDKGDADVTDYYNYGMMEEDWLEYSESQLAVRQELTDAGKQKRLPDPGIVPVVPRAPKVQGDRVAVRLKKADDSKDEGGADQARKNEQEDDSGLEMVVELGPLMAVKKEVEDKERKGKKAKEENKETALTPDTSAVVKQEKVIGGAWGAGAAKDSVLMRLIQEQSGVSVGGNVGSMPPGNVMGGPPMMNVPPPHHMMAPPMISSLPHKGIIAPPPIKQEQYGNNNAGGNHRYGDGGSQWKREQHQDFHRRGSGGGGCGPPDHHHQQQHPLHHRGGRGGYQQQQGFGGRVDYPSHNQQGQFRHQQQQQQQQQHQRPPPGQFHHRGGLTHDGYGGGQGEAPPPSQHGRYHHQQQQGHWGGGPGNNRGYCGPPPRGGVMGGPPPPHGSSGNWDGRKRPRNDYGRDPRGDPRRGRW